MVSLSNSVSKVGLMQQIDQINGQLSKNWETLEQMSKALTAVDKKAKDELRSTANHVAMLSGRMDAIDGRVVALSSSVSDGVSAINGQVDALHKKLSAVTDAIVMLNSRMDGLANVAQVSVKEQDRKAKIFAVVNPIFSMNVNVYDSYEVLLSQKVRLQPNGPEILGDVIVLKKSARQSDYEKRATETNLGSSDKCVPVIDKHVKYEDFLIRLNVSVL